MALRPPHSAPLLAKKPAAIAPFALASAAFLLAAPTPALASDDDNTPTFQPEYWEFYGQAEIELTGYAEDHLFPGQKRDNVSFAARPTLLAEWLDGDLAFKLTPFARIDGADDRRTHFDLREAKFDYRSGNWSFTVGADFVFWGKTEAVHLVDIINSDDGVESLDLEDKLGQPMVKVAYLSDWGEFSAFYLPYFRKPTYAGTEGRLRGSLPVDNSLADFRVDGDEFAPSFAARWSHVIGDVDFGVSAFYGTSRDPALAPANFDAFGRPTALRPIYHDIAQVGFDGQYTAGPALWKLEAIGRANQLDRRGQDNDYIAVTGGVEYTFYGVAETNADLGLILEGAWDSRGNEALTPFEEDVIAGARLALNDEQDTSLLFTVATDVVSGTSSLRLEAERRIYGSWKAEVEAQAFLNTQPAELEHDLRRDTFAKLKLTYFW